MKPRGGANLPRCSGARLGEPRSRRLARRLRLGFPPPRVPEIPLQLLLPLFASLVFASGTLCLKRAFQEGAGVGPAFLLNNLVLGLAFLPLLVLSGQPVPWRDALLPGLTGLAFFAGHLTNFAAVRRGDVSLVTPLLGTKVVFVAALGWLLFRHALTWTHLAAALLTALGVFVMGLGEAGGRFRWGASTLLALGSAAAFGLCDTLIQQWAGGFGVLPFAALLFGTVAVLSLGLLPGVGGAVLRVPRRAWPWLVASAVLTAGQAVLITGSIAKWGDATGVNVVYSLRGLWGILLVWVVGHWFGNAERQTAGRRVLTARLVGALLIVAAVGLVVWGG